MHLPVLKEEVIKSLEPETNQNFIDCTAGEGGHTFAIIEKTGPNGKVLAIDKDERNIEIIKEKAKSFGLEGRIIAKEGNYADIEEIVEKEGFNDISGIIFDLGISSWHIDESGRGFSFQKDEPLDMRYSTENGITAWEIVNSWPPEEIEIILKDLGEERFAKRISKAIVTRRKEKKIDTASELASLVEKEVPRTKRIHPATKTFQALRITVNRELENIEKVLPSALELIKEGGRISIISFHSLEDRIAKNFFRQVANEGRVRILTKKPIIPGEDEIINNPRSRSAKLRTAIKIKQE